MVCIIIHVCICISLRKTVFREQDFSQRSFAQIKNPHARYVMSIRHVAMSYTCIATPEPDINLKCCKHGLGIHMHAEKSAVTRKVMMFKKTIYFLSVERIARKQWTPAKERRKLHVTSRPDCLPAWLRFCYSVCLCLGVPYVCKKRH